AGPDDDGRYSTRRRDFEVEGGGGVPAEADRHVVGEAVPGLAEARAHGDPDDGSVGGNVAERSGRDVALGRLYRESADQVRGLPGPQRMSRAPVDRIAPVPAEEEAPRVAKGIDTQRDLGRSGLEGHRRRVGEPVVAEDLESTERPEAGKGYLVAEARSVPGLGQLKRSGPT